MMSSPSASKLLEAFDIIRAEWETNTNADVVSMAKKICEYRGENADMVVMTSPPCYGPKGSTAIMYPLKPVWALHIDDAVMIMEMKE